MDAAIAALDQPLPAVPAVSPVEPIVIRGLATRLTSERAKALWVKRRAKAAEAAAKLIPPPPIPPIDQFSSQQREIVRARLAQVNTAMESALSAVPLDASAVDRLAAAWAKLGELERTLDGRPLPGSMRPRPERRQVRGAMPGPMDG